MGNFNETPQYDHMSRFGMEGFDNLYHLFNLYYHEMLKEQGIEQLYISDYPNNIHLYYQICERILQRKVLIGKIFQKIKRVVESSVTELDEDSIMDIMKMSKKLLKNNNDDYRLEFGEKFFRNLKDAIRFSSYEEVGTAIETVKFIKTKYDEEEVAIKNDSSIDNLEKLSRLRDINAISIKLPLLIADLEDISKNLAFINALENIREQDSDNISYYMKEFNKLLKKEQIHPEDYEPEKVIVYDLQFYDDLDKDRIFNGLEDIMYRDDNIIDRYDEEFQLDYNPGKDDDLEEDNEWRIRD
jgi:hypothetical protein